MPASAWVFLLAILPAWMFGVWFVYSYGKRQVQLLEQIRDLGISMSKKLHDGLEVDIPALSPGRPDESDPPEPRTGDNPSC